MLEKKSKFGALLWIVAIANNIYLAFPSVSTFKPITVVSKKIPISLNKKIKSKRIVNLSHIEELVLKTHFNDLMKAVRPCFAEIMSRAYNSYLISMGERMKDLFPVSITLSMENNSNFSFTEDKQEIAKTYKKDPDLQKYLNNGMSMREQAALADFVEKQFLQISYRGPMFSTSIQSYIASSRLERNTKLKEALDSISKISEMIFDLYNHHRALLVREKQVGYLEKNLSDVKVKISVGSGSEIDQIEAEETLTQYKSKLDQDILRVSNLRRRCKDHNIDPDEVINILNKTTKEIISSKKIPVEDFIKKFEDSIKFKVLKEEYSSSRMGALASGVSSFSPTLDLSANFGKTSREFNFGMKIEGVKFGQFLKAIGQREKAAHNYNHSLKNLYGEFLDLLNTYEFLFKKHGYLLNSVLNDVKIRKSMQSILNDAALKDSNRKISESDVLKSKIAEEEARINLMNCEGDILKQSFQILLSLFGERDFRDIFNNSKGKVKSISLKDLKEGKILKTASSLEKLDKKLDKKSFQARIRSSYNKLKSQRDLIKKISLPKENIMRKI